MGRFRRLPYGLWRDKRGIAAVEMAAVVPFLLLLTVACVDFGRLLSQRIDLTNAVKAGAQYATTDSASESRVLNVITNALPSHLQGATPYASCFCAAPGVASAPVVACSAVCPAGNVRTMTLRAEIDFVPVGFTLPGAARTAFGMNRLVSNVTIRHQ